MFYVAVHRPSSYHPSYSKTSLMAPKLVCASLVRSDAHFYLRAIWRICRTPTRLKSSTSERPVVRSVLRLPLHRKLVLLVSCVRCIITQSHPISCVILFSSPPRRSVKISQKRPPLGRVCASPCSSPSRTVRPRSRLFPQHLRSSSGRSKVCPITSPPCACVRSSRRYSRRAPTGS